MSKKYLKSIINLIGRKSIVKNKVNIVSYSVLLFAFLYTSFDGFHMSKSNYEKINQLKGYRRKVIVHNSKNMFRSTILKLNLDTTSHILREVLAHTPTLVFVTAKNLPLLRSYSIVIATTYLSTKVIKTVIRKKRPDGNGNDSFPSGHAVQSMVGSVFMHLNYSLAYALPMYIISLFVGFIRIFANRHDITDVLFGFYIGTIGALYSDCIFHIGMSVLLRTTNFVKKFYYKIVRKKAKK